MDKEKFCCFVDETGQDTEGKFFLVCAVLFEQEMRDYLEPIIESIEKKTGKYKTKWKYTNIKIKRLFLQEIVNISELRQSLFYSVYRNTTKYNFFTSLTVAKAVKKRAPDDYFVSVIVDALTKKDAEKMRIVFKDLKVKYKNIRGMKDEQSVFLRLADALAGFVRDYMEGDKYTKDFFELLKERGMIQEV
jgi:hypothetical protein